MDQVFTILYEDSTPARNKISFYNVLAADAGLTIHWQQKTSVTNGYEQLNNGEADAILIAGQEDFNELREKELTALISKQHDRRLVALFSPSVDPLYFTKKNSALYPLTIAADFEWQAQMAANFLSAALPQRTTPYQFVGMGDEHGFNDRLGALRDGRIDIAILSLADLDLSTDAYTRKLKFMVLPLFECPPGIYQGTTGIIIKDENSLLANAVKQAGDVKSTENYHEEYSLLSQNAPGSYGVFSMNLPSAPFTYLAGNEQGRTKEIWQMDAALPESKKLFSTTAYMKDFFRYEYPDVEKIPAKPVSFIASHKAVNNEKHIVQLASRRVWAAGTKTWFELAKKGIWVEGSADGLGLETLAKGWTGIFTGIDKDSVVILTNTESAKQWMMDGWSATGTYKLIPSITPEIIKGLEAAEAIFWTSYQQYQACREFVKPGVLHGSPAGKTAVLIKKDGNENTFVFPSIKAFNWYQGQVNKKI